MATFIPGNSFFEFYRDLAQQSSDFWTQALTMPRSFEPSENWQRIYDMWATFWTRAYTPSAEVCQAAQKLWLEHLDTTSKGLERLMDANAYGTAASKLFQDQAACQKQMARVVMPQIDGVLRLVNLPSRSQIDQLFKRAVGLEERLDDLETESRQMRQILRMSADALGELKQDLTALAAQLAGMNQHLQAIEARVERTTQPGAQPPAQPSRSRSRRKSPPSS